MAQNKKEKLSSPLKSGTISGFRDAFKKAVTELLILRLLQDSDMYAYEMQREIERKSTGVLSFNTLYLAIYRLKDYGFIEVRRKEIIDGRERVYFGITENGQHRFDELSDEYLRLVDAMEKMMLFSTSSE